MTLQDVNSGSNVTGEPARKVTVALVCKYTPEGIGGIENHLDMLQKNVQAPDCSYVYIGGSGYVKFVRRLRRSRSDLMHFHGFDRLQLLALMLFARRRIPLVVTPHNGVAAIVNDQNSARRFAKRWIDGVLFRVLIWQRARIIALTAEERDYYLSRFPGSVGLVEVLPNPTEKHEWAPLALENPTLRLLSISRLDWWKRTQDLISAMALLPPGVECDIAGPDQGAEAGLRDQAGQLARTIRFHGAVRGAQKDALFETASVVVIPSKAEGLSTVALEALARGIPVIVSDCAARGLPTDGVYTYPFGSVADLARTVGNLLTRENLMTARDAARRASATLVSYDDYGRALRALYRASAEGRPA